MRRLSTLHIVLQTAVIEELSWQGSPDLAALVILIFNLMVRYFDRRYTNFANLCWSLRLPSPLFSSINTTTTAIMPYKSVILKQLHHHPTHGGSFAGVASDGSVVHEFAMRAMQQSGATSVVQLSTQGPGSDHPTVVTGVLNRIAGVTPFIAPTRPTLPCSSYTRLSLLYPAVATGVLDRDGRGRTVHRTNEAAMV
ncbi:uncharacterized protein FTJAE_3046 [Fusarium tjaetaba]|uniref:Uncharacterized protein n=1 Tax=Fusarium tjaetaba TaxID=1567544 RepID=A0A8H5S359_9HYPO|nr:uncharacterized protein FTJAE_3046 [Fusarium tjaetaba]KAF5643748.1 hypothetical protein FTJAE_3046 [Fusarium tjaetaba]